MRVSYLKATANFGPLVLLGKVIQVVLFLVK